MAEMQFAAGAHQKVVPLHDSSGEYYTSWAQAKAAINAFDMKPFNDRRPAVRT